MVSTNPLDPFSGIFQTSQTSQSIHFRSVESCFPVFKFVAVCAASVCLPLCGVVGLFRPSEGHRITCIRNIHRILVAGSSCARHHLHCVGHHLSREEGPPHTTEYEIIVCRVRNEILSHFLFSPQIWAPVTCHFCIRVYHFSAFCCCWVSLTSKLLNIEQQQTDLFDVLAVCTPLGIVRLFGVVGQVLVKPHLMRDVDEKYHAFYLEEASVKRKIDNLQNVAKENSLTTSTSTSSSSSSSSSFLKYCDINSIPKNFGSIADTLLKHRTNGHNRANKFYNTVEVDQLYERLRELKSEQKELGKLRSSSAFQRNLVYPLAMLALLALTGFTILMVVQNTLELVIGIKALPLSTRETIQTVRVISESV